MCKWFRHAFAVVVDTIVVVHLLHAQTFQTDPVFGLGHCWHHTPRGFEVQDGRHVRAFVSRLHETQGIFPITDLGFADCSSPRQETPHVAEHSQPISAGQVEQSDELRSDVCEGGGKESTDTCINHSAGTQPTKASGYCLGFLYA